ncbi:MAG: hypothetical protein VX223_13895, partial [Myxococcota bacterium]|nr:hypothetical protein [Myxococcota bacterium]
DGLTALVQMMALSVSEAIWEEVTGRPLTAPHNLPRNAMQRDVLQHLASTFVSSGYSLKAILRATVLHPYFAQSAPADCAAGLDAYYLSPIYDPWSIESATAQMHGNSVGDQVSRLPARVLLRSLTSALDWPQAPRFFPQDDTVEQVKLSPIAEVQRDIGAFMTDGEIGFRGSTFQETLAWESAFGGCRPPDAMTTEAPDFIDSLETAAAGHTLYDAVSALKDRLLADPAISSPGEEAVLQALAGYQLDSPLDELPDANGALRRICTAFISSPQFLLFGITPTDRLTSSVSSPLPGVSPEMHCDRVSKLVSNAYCNRGNLQITR